MTASDKYTYQRTVLCLARVLAGIQPTPWDKVGLQAGGVRVCVCACVCVCECASVGVGLRMGWQLACKLKIEFFAQLTLTLAARDMRVALGLLLSSSNADPLLTFVI